MDPIIFEYCAVEFNDEGELLFANIEITTGNAVLTEVFVKGGPNGGFLYSYGETCPSQDGVDEDCALTAGTGESRVDVCVMYV